MSIFEQFSKEKKGMKMQITRLRNTVSQAVSEGTELPTRFDRFKRVEKCFDEFHGKFLNELADSESELEELISIEESFYELSALIKTTEIRETSSTSSLQSHETAVNRGHQSGPFALPRIAIPKFSGAPEEWLPFYDCFSSLVAENKALSNVEKMHHLKAALQGSAASTIASISITADNYEIAWTTLCERYDNKKLLISNQLRLLFGMSKVRDGASLRTYTDTLKKYIRGLESIEEPTVDMFLIFIATGKLDEVSREKWEEYSHDIALPSTADFLEFLQKRCQIMENQGTSQKPRENSSAQVEKRPIRTSNSFVTSNVSCVKCNGEHTLSSCSKFRALTVQLREEDVRRLKLCFNCLSHNHAARNCRAGNCRICQGRHHTLLHRAGPRHSARTTDSGDSNLQYNSEPSSGHNAQPSMARSAEMQTQAISNVGITSESTPEAGANLITLDQQRNCVLLSTAIVDVFNIEGNKMPCRVLLDTGSQNNFISEVMMKKLRLATLPTNVAVTGIGSSVASINRKTSVNFKSKFTNFELRVECLVIPQITQYVPSYHWSSSKLCIPPKIQLADPNQSKSGHIDMLIGSGIFWSLILNDRLYIDGSNVVLVETVLGWITAGSIRLSKCTQATTCLVSMDGLNRQMEKFWLIENLKTEQSSNKEHPCELWFQSTTLGEDKRFVVQLPFGQNVSTLGNNYHSAQRQFFALERRLSANPKLKREYHEVIQDYINNGHMTPIESTDGYFMPHHGVVKPESTTTKLRVVFNGSSKPPVGLSLNDVLLVGPTVQDTLTEILLRFRTHQFVIAADIAKMYRQVWVASEHRKYQKIIWRQSVEDPLQHFTLNTVTFGTASAPFLATRCLQQVFLDGASRFPESAKIGARDFYVDDLLTGAAALKDAETLCSEINTLLLERGFQLRKWNSNNSQLLATLSSLGSESVRLGENDAVKTLGLLWKPHSDCLQYSVVLPNKKETSKREVLSTIAKIYDPLGLLGPIIVSAKILMQRLWQRKLNWDDPLPVDMQTAWDNYRDNLELLNKVSVDRKVIQRDSARIELHGFCDASEAAYGACIYMRTIGVNGVNCQLLCAKSRVAPVKTISLPRLELCGAVLLSELMCAVTKALCLEIADVVFWTDSTIVLAWLTHQPNQLKTFVANRVSQIQQTSEASSWRHIRSQQNPADVLSRGCVPTELANTNWWAGPEFLQEKSVPLTNPISPCLEVPDQKATICLVSQEPCELITKFPTFTKLVRICALCKRFAFNVRTRREERLYGPMTVKEVAEAKNVLIKIAQNECFSADMVCWRQGREPKKSTLKPLSAFLDDQGILRVGGRLREVAIPFNQKYPIILPKGHTLTKLIVRDAHVRQLHGGAQAVLAYVRRQYWPIDGRNLVKGIIRECLVCFKCKPPNPPNQKMGDLPETRVTPSRPFLNSGVDYCGPFYLRASHRRGSKLNKAYVVVFVCFSTKAVHLDLVMDLTSEAFINCLKRFISRRGRVLNMYSDNATTFVGANNELKELRQLLIDEEHQFKVQRFAVEEGINWRFIPARSPHFGGLWESAVKSAKHHLSRIAGKSHLTYEEMFTLLAEVEACLNSRPLIPLSDDPQDLNVLTPGHFLIGAPLTSLPEPTLMDVATNRLSHWQKLQQIFEHFWRKWSAEYLSTLQQRQKWPSKNENQVQIGDLVLIREENLPAMNWKMGRIEQFHKGKDNIDRVATVKTLNNTSRYALRRLCPLPTHRSV